MLNYSARLESPFEENLTIVSIQENSITRSICEKGPYTLHRANPAILQIKAWNPEKPDLQNKSLKSGNTIIKVFPKSGGDSDLELRCPDSRPVLSPIHCTSPNPRTDGGKWGQGVWTQHPSSVSLIHFPGPPIGYPSIFYLCLSESRSIGLGLPIPRVGCVTKLWNHTSSHYPHLFNGNNDPPHPAFLGGMLWSSNKIKWT